MRPFRPKTSFEASRAVFLSLSCYKELKSAIKPFAGCTLRGSLSIRRFWGGGGGGKGGREKLKSPLPYPLRKA